MPSVAATIVVAAVLVSEQQARADIGIWSVSRASGAPGEPVDLLIACGGCLPRSVRLPVSLLPASSAPGQRSAPEPPAGAPYVELGDALPLRGGPSAAERIGLEIPDAVARRGTSAVREWVASINRLRFRIPEADPGLYAYVLYCEGCRRGPGGSLIMNASEPRNLLRIRATGDSGGAAAATTWLFVAAGVMVLLALAGLTLRRRS